MNKTFNSKTANELSEKYKLKINIEKKIDYKY